MNQGVSNALAGQAVRHRPPIYLQEVGEQDQRLLTDEGMGVLQTQGNVGNVSVHHGCVTDTQITHDDDNVIANSHIL